MASSSPDRSGSTRSSSTASNADAAVGRPPTADCISSSTWSRSVRSRSPPVSTRTRSSSPPARTSVMSAARPPVARQSAHERNRSTRPLSPSTPSSSSASSSAGVMPTNQLRAAARARGADDGRSSADRSTRHCVAAALSSTESFDDDAAGTPDAESIATMAVASALERTSTPMSEGASGRRPPSAFGSAMVTSPSMRTTSPTRSCRASALASGVLWSGSMIRSWSGAAPGPGSTRTGPVSEVTARTGWNATEGSPNVNPENRCSSAPMSAASERRLVPRLVTCGPARARAARYAESSAERKR